MSNTLQPLSQSHRNVTLDILRGFALAGVLFVFCVSDNAPAPGYANSFLDELISWPKYILVESRMYGMLIILFGIGFQVQLEKARKHGTTLVPVFTRRVLGLIILGFIHAIILSSRDILMFYGIAGAVLLLVRNATTRQLILLMLIVFYVIAPVIQYNVRNPWPQVAALSEPDNYPDYVSYNWQYFLLYHQTYTIYLEMLFHFLLGVVISRSGLLQKIKTNKQLRQRLLTITLAGAVVLIPFWYFWLPDLIPRILPKNPHPVVRFGIGIAYRSIWEIWMLVSVTLYATLLISISSSETKKKYFKPLAAFGQMALSNYLIQSLVLVPWLLLANKIKNLGPSEGIVVFLIVFALQLLFSTWWMTRYKLGPFEWLLRSFTYWKWQTLKKPVQLNPGAEKQIIRVPAT